tara:strand:- start:27 stop:488 length:462 start_codon:yes stop_codon:yes gene_type:complete
LGNGSCRRFRKFYEDQVKEILGLLEKEFRDGQVSLDTYLDICEQKGIEPDPDEMPPTMGDYPPEVQVAFLLHDLLPDRWDGMSGSYFGKDMSALDLLLETWEVEDKRTTIFFIKKIEAYNSKQINEKLKRKREASERQAKAKAGSKSGINVKG